MFQRAIHRYNIHKWQYHASVQAFTPFSSVLSQFTWHLMAPNFFVSTPLTMLVWACWYTFQHSQPHMAWPVYYIWKIAIKDVWVGKIPFVVETKAKVILLLQQAFKNGWQLLEPVFLCCRCSGLILRCGSVFSLGEPLTHCWEGPASPFQRWDLRVFCSA